MAANQQIQFAEASSDDADPSSPADDDRDDRVRPDRDALRRENRRLRSRVYALERALNEHERRRQAIVDQYELVLDGRDGRLERLTDSVRRDAVREDRADPDERPGNERPRDQGAQSDRVERSAPEGRSTGVLAALRRTLAPPYR